MTTVLCVAAHPDDETDGCGGTLAKWAKRGARITLLVLTRCAVASRYDVDEARATARRRGECLEAAKALGVTDVRFLDFPEIQLAQVPISTLIDSIRGVVNDVRPETILTHSSADLNQDHRIAAEATMVAVRPFTYPELRRLLAYPVDPLPIAEIRPTFAVDIVDTLPAKLAALSAYTSEIRAWPNRRSPEGLEHMARFQGARFGIDAAEIFDVIWEVERA